LVVIQILGGDPKNGVVTGDNKCAVVASMAALPLPGRPMIPSLDDDDVQPRSANKQNTSNSLDTGKTPQTAGIQQPCALGRT
jgi:hypothetical protein